MTRDQANRIVDSIWNKLYQRLGEKSSTMSVNKTNWLVDCLEALGVLHFENTDVTSYEVVHCLAGQLVVIESSRGFASGEVAKLHSSGGMSVLEALDRSGFKVVRK